MNRLTARILDVSNAFHNKTFPIHEKLFVSPPPYYFNYSEISYPNVPLIRDSGPSFTQCICGIQRTKKSGKKRNLLLDTVVIIMK